MHKYEDEVKNILKASESIATENNDLYLNTKHILIALLEIDNSLKDILINNGIQLEEVNTYINKGDYHNSIVLYSKEILNIIENLVLDEMEENYTITLPAVFLEILNNKNTECYKILDNLNIDIENLINEIKSKNIISTNLKIMELAINLNEEAKNGRLERVIGRDKEIGQIIEVLARKNKNNPILIGEAGVGKTAIVEEIARRIINNEVPLFLKDKIIFNLNLANVIAGTKYRGEFEEKLTKIIKELEENKNIILFIDEVHTLVGAGGAEGAIDASNILKPALARNKIKMIGATTITEYKNTIEKDKALDRRMQKVIINEPNVEETLNIINKVKTDYEKYHNVTIKNDIIKMIVKLSNKYIKNKKQPDKSIDLLDQICASTSINKNSNTNKYKKLDKLINQKKKYLKNNELEKASNIKSKIDELKTSLNNNKNTKNTVSIANLKSVLERKIFSPIYELEDDNYLNNLEKELNKTIVGQEKAIDKLVNITKEIFKNENNKPTSILLTGKVGVGKTLISNEYANILKLHSLKLDGRDFLSLESLNKIVGSSAGYIGYEDKNTIFESIKNYPVSIIIVDNYHLINNQIKKKFENILDTGKLKLSNNEIIDFSDSIFIFTTNDYKETPGFINNDKINTNNIFEYTIKLNNLTEENIKEIIKRKNITKDINYIISKCNYKNNGAKNIETILKEKLILS